MDRDRRKSAHHGRSDSPSFGSDTVKELAAKVGLSPDVLAAKLSQVLPQAIDKLTPTGAVPKT